VEFYQDFTLGIVGGGQLGRMLIQSAIDLNVDVAILDADPNAPCSKLASRFVNGPLTDYNTLLSFGRTCDLVTIEIENVNVKALYQLQKEGVKVYPQPEVIELIQDKRKQKQFYQDQGIPTADFVLVENAEDVKNHAEFLPAFNKLGKEGYDGRGVQRIASASDLNKAFDKPGLLEKLIDFEKELSVIVARNAKGEMKAFPPVELVFHPEANLVEYLFAPARISGDKVSEATEIAQKVIEKLDMVGLLAVEMFLDKEGQIFVNEIAPRPHNSGHQTIEANVTSQYEQHLRAIFNMPLGDTGILQPSAMVNLLGEPGYEGLARYEGLEKVLAVNGAHVHLYGKKITKPYRKMGHVTIVDNKEQRLLDKADFIKRTLKIKA
jgi:5-(carboxyamino)imidazole ribonucleotide synthase